MKLNQSGSAWLIGALAVAIAGCASYERQDFGQAVKHMQAAQRATPDAEATPLDAQLGQRVLQRYRTDVAEPEEIRNEIIINIGN